MRAKNKSKPLENPINNIYLFRIEKLIYFLNPKFKSYEQIRIN